VKLLDLEAAAKAVIIRTKAEAAAQAGQLLPIDLLLAVLNAHRGLWVLLGIAGALCALLGHLI